MMPNFFIVGAPKAGTTSLYHYLKQHPDIFISDPKELNFFSSEEIINQGLYYKSLVVNKYEEYEKYFINSKNKKAIGEASVSYLYYSEVPKRIYKLIPNAKIIIMLRDPVKRGFSHYQMDKRLGYIKLSFEDVIFKKSDSKFLDLYFQQYIEQGFYYENVKRYFDVFGKKNVKILLFDNFKNSTIDVIREVFIFLGLDESFFPNLSEQYNRFRRIKNPIFQFFYKQIIIRFLIKRAFPNKIRRLIENIFSDDTKPELNWDSKKYLYNLYLNDILKLEKLIGMNLNGWKNG